MSDLRGDWDAQIKRATALTSLAVELSALSEKELSGLVEHLETNVSARFEYVSIHGPAKDRVLPEDELVERLMTLTPHADAIVLHPDTIIDPLPYRALGRRLVLENLDVRRSDGRTVEELSQWFRELPEAGFCFDVAHAWSVDPTMSTGKRLLDAFRMRLRHLHVSSLSSELKHIPLTIEHEALFMPLLRRCIDVPWILEAPPRSS
jgi:hypothetical protein